MHGASFCVICQTYGPPFSGRGLGPKFHLFHMVKIRKKNMFSTHTKNRFGEFLFFRTPNNYSKSVSGLRTYLVLKL